MYERYSPESMLYSTNSVSNTGQSYPYLGYHPAQQPPNQYMEIQYCPPPPPPPPPLLYGYDHLDQYYSSSTPPDPGLGQDYNYQSQLSPPPKAKPKKPKQPKKSKSVKQTSYKVCSNQVSQNTGDNHKIYNIAIKYSFRDLSHAEDGEGKEVGIQYGRRDLKEEQGNMLANGSDPLYDQPTYNPSFGAPPAPAAVNGYPGYNNYDPPPVPNYSYGYYGNIYPSAESAPPAHAPYQPHGYTNYYTPQPQPQPQRPSTYGYSSNGYSTPQPARRPKAKKGKNGKSGTSGTSYNVSGNRVSGNKGDGNGVFNIGNTHGLRGIESEEEEED
ncbi:hypothetical protein ACFX1T_021745 [Malus domestica]